MDGCGPPIIPGRVLVGPGDVYLFGDQPNKHRDQAGRVSLSSRQLMSSSKGLLPGAPMPVSKVGTSLSHYEAGDICLRIPAGYCSSLVISSFNATTKYNNNTGTNLQGSSCAMDPGTYDASPGLYGFGG